MAKMTQQQAAQEVIKLKKQYDASAKAGANFSSSDSAKQLSQQAAQIRQQYGLDDSKYGSGATLAQAYTNYYKDFGKSTTTTNTPVVNQVPKQSEEVVPLNINYQPSVQDQEILKMIQSLPTKVMGYDEAKGMADEQLGYEYDKALANTLKNVDRQALQSGFFGQLPTVDYKQRNADDIERARASGIAQLANQLMSESKNDVNNSISQLLQYSNIQSDKENQAWQKAFQERGYVDNRSDANWDKSFKERQYTDSRNDVDWEKLFKERQFQAGREDAEWNKGVTEAQLTGIFKGNPTMALTELTHNMGMDTKKMEMAEKELNHNITMSWEKLKNDRIGLSQAAQRIGLQGAGLALDNKKFLAGIKEKAFDMAKETFGLTMGSGSNGGDMSWWIDSPSGVGQSKVSNGDVMDLMDTYTRILLGEASIDDIYNTEIGRFYNTSSNRYDGRAK